MSNNYTEFVNANGEQNRKKLLQRKFVTILNVNNIMGNLKKEMVPRKGDKYFGYISKMK